MSYISIFQSITQNLLLFTLQRYEFFSKSQRMSLEYYFVIDVIYYLAPPKFRKVKHSGISKVKQPTKYSIIKEMWWKNR